jgi:hypothetical protein
MAEWKKLVTSGSNISQLNNDAGYLTSATVPSKNAFATASINGTVLIADSPSGSLNFTSSSGQGLTISGNSGTDTLTWGLAAIPNSSLLNSGSIIGTTPVNLGTTVTSIAGLTLTTAVVSGSLFGTASWATNAITAASASTVAVTDTTTGTGPYYIMFADGTTGNRAVRVDSSTLTFNATTNTLTVTSSYAISASQALTASFALNANSDLAIAGDTGTGTVDLQTQTLIVSGTANEITTTASGQTITIGLPTNVTIAGDLAVNGGDITTTQLTASLFNSTATQVNIGGSALQMRIGNAAGTITIPGNLTVQGTTTTISSSVLEIADQFILLASGSNTNVDGGLIVQNATDGSGHAFGYGTPENRWVMQSSLNSLSSSFASIDGYVTTTQYGLSGAKPANPSYGGATYGYGNIYTATDTGEIFIYA